MRWIRYGSRIAAVCVLAVAGIAPMAYAAGEAPGAPGGQRERHGVTAIAVTSTSHSGLARACTTTPVKQGYTPRIRSPSTP